MDRPVLRIFAAVFWAIWFTVIGPLHVRGMITVDGTGGLARAALPPCCVHKGETGSTDKPQDGRDGPSTPAERCAVCMTITAAGADAPAVLPALEPAETREVAGEFLAGATEQAGVDHFHCRGPPVA